jgi:hypothetical protein
MRHDRVSRDHFRREPYPCGRDPRGGSLRRGGGRTWTSSHAACQHVRTCRLIKGSDGSSLATLRRRRVGRMWRRDVRLPSDSKSPRPVSRRGLDSCDVEFMPVICPTCQIFCATFANAFLFKSLNRRCGLIAGNRFGSFGYWRRSHAGNGLGSFASGRRTDLGGRLFPRCDAGLSCMLRSRSRCGSPHSPGTRDRGPCRISNERACHRAHRSQDDRSRHRPQGSISSTILGSCFARHKCPCDQGANKQFLHRGSPRMRRERKGLRNCGGTKVMRPTGSSPTGRTNGSQKTRSSPPDTGSDDGGFKKPAAGFSARA